LIDEKIIVSRDQTIQTYFNFNYIQFISKVSGDFVLSKRDKMTTYAGLINNLAEVSLSLAKIG
jgi:hypothetical protein